MTSWFLRWRAASTTELQARCCAGQVSCGVRDKRPRFLAVDSLPFGSKNRLRMTRLYYMLDLDKFLAGFKQWLEIATPTAMLWTAQMAPLTAARLIATCADLRLSSALFGDLVFRLREAK